MKPAYAVSPVQSCAVAPAGMGVTAAGPTATIQPSFITMVASSITVPGCVTTVQCTRASWRTSLTRMPLGGATCATAVDAISTRTPQLTVVMGCSIDR